MEFKELGRSGVKLPVLGLGTWGMGRFDGRLSTGDDEGVGALQLGVALGMRFIDTAETYGNGHSEEIVARAVKSQRENVFIATKVSAEHLSYEDVLRSCERSLRRLETGYIDLYQVHWPNPAIQISETMRAMERLVQDGKIRHIGVSNFSMRQTHEAQEALSKCSLVSDQVEYNLLDRSIEEELLSYAMKQHLTIIAYSPLARGQIPRGGRGECWRVLDQVAWRHRKTRTQTALNWLLFKDPVVAIPKAASLDHVREIADAAGWKITEEEYEKINEAFR